MNFSYYMPARIFFGAGSVEKLSEAAKIGKKAVIVTGGKSTTRLGYVERVRGVLADAGVGSVVYDKVVPNPTKTNVEEIAALIHSEGCDMVLGLGGGSSIDAGKAAAVLAANGGDYWDYICDGSGKHIVPEKKPLPIIAVTTTAGTGTEADPWTVVTNEATQEKVGYGYDGTFPTLSIVDPDFMMTVPANMTAFQGFDALFHSTEGYIANISTPFSDMYAAKAIEFIGKYLPTAVNHGDDKESRAYVALANTIAGMVETASSCTSEHAIEHAMSALFPALPHGAGLTMISAAYYRRFASVCPERLVDMARFLGSYQANKPSDFVDALVKLQKDCGVDELRMSDYGISRDDLPKIADNALFAMSGLFGMDRERLTRDDVLAILSESYK